MIHNEPQDDLYTCSVCKRQLFGLYNYVFHRKTVCREDMEKTTEIEGALREQQSCSKAVQNVVSNNKDALEEFFQSLELQPQNAGKIAEHHGEIFDFISYPAIESEKYAPMTSIFNIFDITIDENGLLDTYEYPKNVSSANKQTVPYVTRKEISESKASSSSLKNPRDASCSDSGSNRSQTSDNNPFNCIICNRTFSNKYSAARHFVSEFHKRAVVRKPDTVQYSGSIYFNRYQCRPCNFFSGTLDHLLTHLSSASHQTASKSALSPFICANCKYVSSNDEDLILHLRSQEHAAKHSKSMACIVKQQRYKIRCKFCGHSQHSLAHMTRHVTTKHAEIITKCSADKLPSLPRDMNECPSKSRKKEFRCRPCELDFDTLLSLIAHQKSLCHLKVDRATESLITGMVTENDLTKEKFRDISINLSSKYEVHENSNLFPSEKVNDLKNSNSLKHSNIVQCNNDETNFSKQESVCSEKITIKNLICQNCGRKFTSLTQLYLHRKTSHSGKSFVCKYEGCSWRFNKRHNFLMHQRRHTGEKPYHCEFCHYSAKDSSLLRKHVLHQHQGHRHKFACEYCDYRAGSMFHLRRHSRIHAGSRPYRCPYCPYASHTHDNLRKHITQTKKHSGQSLYGCRFCHWGCNSVEEFRWHLLKNHSEDVNFNDKMVVSAHTGVYVKHLDASHPCEGQRIIHVREKNHPVGISSNELLNCEYCKYTCKNWETMHQHLQSSNKLHPVVTPTCSLCTYIATSDSDLEAHKVAAHLFNELTY